MFSYSYNFLGIRMSDHHRSKHHGKNSKHYYSKYLDLSRKLNIQVQFRCFFKTYISVTGSFAFSVYGYVSLWYPESMKCSHILEQSLQDCETTMRQNVVLTVFHTQNICHHAWKTLRTTLWCFVFLQSRREGLKSMENYGTDLSHSFSSFHDLFPTIGDQQCIAM